MDWLAFVRDRVGTQAMPMADRFSFELLDVERGRVRARALPLSCHYNPFGVVQGGFASTVLDIAMGLVSITVLPEQAGGVSTVDLSVTYLRPIFESTGPMEIEATIVHAGATLIVARAALANAAGKLHASAQSSSLVIQKPPA